MVSKRSPFYIAPPAPIATFAERQPPSGALINVILQYADVQQPIGDGRVSLRLSAQRAKDSVIKGMLGREARRLAEVSVLWDEAEGEIIQVMDDAETPAAAPDAFNELDTFELTELALDYIARHKSRAKARAR
ncbi:MAG TPA: hypothetical protein VGI95_02295 [Caulobacteraceae bacterium]|jgi:hypothetical protein